METYKALKIIESYRQLLTENGIVICTVITVDQGEQDVIDYIYHDEYSEFEIVDCYYGE
jgi:hypothetical protein